MKTIALDRTFSPSLPTPMTLDQWLQMHHTLDGCLEVREVEWLFSLVALKGDRSLCLFAAPYADAVREACRESRMPFQQVWQAELWADVSLKQFSNGTSLIVAEVNYDPPMTRDGYEAAKAQATGCFQELGVQHLQSVMNLNGTHSVCLFSASSAEEVRSLYRKVGMPFEQVWKATLLQPIGEPAAPMSETV